MSVLEQLEAAANAGHADDALVAVSVGLLRTITDQLRAGDAAEAQLLALTGTTEGTTA